MLFVGLEKRAAGIDGVHNIIKFKAEKSPFIGGTGTARGPE